jgi:hypothetical protein
MPLKGLAKVKVKLTLYLMKQYVMKAYGGVDEWIHVLLTSALVGGEWSVSRPLPFYPRGKSPGAQWKGGWVDPRAGQNNMEKFNS